MLSVRALRIFSRRLKNVNGALTNAAYDADAVSVAFSCFQTLHSMHFGRNALQSMHFSRYITVSSIQFLHYSRRYSVTEFFSVSLNSTSKLEELEAPSDL